MHRIDLRCDTGVDSCTWNTANPQGRLVHMMAKGSVHARATRGELRPQFMLQVGSPFDAQQIADYNSSFPPEPALVIHQNETPSTEKRRGEIIITVRDGRIHGLEFTPLQ